MNVLHVIPTYHPAFVYGGPIRSTHQMNLALAAGGADVRVLTTDSNGADRLPESGKTITYGPALTVQYKPRTFMPDISFALLWSLPKAIRWADVVHITAVYSFSTIPALAWSALLGKPVFWSPRGALQEWEGSPKRGLKKVWDAVCRAVAPGNTTIVAASEREAQAARARFPEMKVVIIPNSVRIPNAVTRRESQEFRLLFLGRLHPIKGIENLIDACALLPEDLKRRTRLRLAGPSDAAYRNSLQEKVDRLGLSNGVEFMGEVNEHRKESLFGDTDILILPSFSENFGLVVVEALAHGVPVIVSENTPWKSVDEKQCGRCIPNDASTIALVLQEMAAADLPSMGRKGRDWMQAEFSQSERTSELLACYNEAMRGRS